MQVCVHKGQLDWFRRKARNCYPNEIYALLIGKFGSKNVLHVYYFAYPRLDTSKPGLVEANAESVLSIMDDAAEEGLRVVGSIHTHPDWPPILSPTDYKGHIDGGDAVSGVVEVTNNKTRVAFWRHDTSLRCDLVYF